MHTNTFCKYRKKLLASPRVHLVKVSPCTTLIVTEKSIIQYNKTGHPIRIMRDYNLKIKIIITIQ